MTLDIMIISCVKRFNAQQSDNYNFAIKGYKVKQFLNAHNMLTTPAKRKSNIVLQRFMK